VLATLLSALKSKKGILGAVVLLGNAIYGLISVLGHVDVAVNYGVPVVDFLGTGPGVLLTVAAAVVLILWAISQQGETKPANAILAPESRQDDQQLATRLQASERESERLKKELEEARSSTSGDPRYPELIKELEQLRKHKGDLERLVHNREIANQFKIKETVQNCEEERDDLKGKVEQLRKENERLKAEESKNLQGQRRKRIDEWREVIRNFDFESENFGATDTYS